MDDIKVTIDKKLLEDVLREAFEQGWAGFKDLQEEIVGDLLARCVKNHDEYMAGMKKCVNIPTDFVHGQVAPPYSYIPSSTEVTVNSPPPPSSWVNTPPITWEASNAIGTVTVGDHHFGSLQRRSETQGQTAVPIRFLPEPGDLTITPEVYRRIGPEAAARVGYRLESALTNINISTNERT